LKLIHDSQNSEQDDQEDKGTGEVLDQEASLTFFATKQRTIKKENTGKTRGTGGRSILCTEVLYNKG
jgi:hypothetical protein